MNKIVFFAVLLNISEQLNTQQPGKIRKVYRSLYNKEYVLTIVSSSVVVLRSGLYYFSQGWKLTTLPDTRRSAILSLLVSILLMGGAFWWLLTQLDSWIPALMSHVPDWLQWLSYLLWPIATISVLLVFGYLSSTIANWTTASFNGLLAEQLEARLTGATPLDTGVLDIMKDVPRIMKREWQKLAWYLPRAIVSLILYFIPGIGQTVAPVSWPLFSAWMLAIQYYDYPFDNHKVPFREMRVALRTRKVTNMQFGALISLFTMTPVLNLFIILVAVCGTMAMWADCHRVKHTLWK